MTVDVFKPQEMIEIANLAGVVEKFNREQHGDKPLFAEVIFYRGGDDVASLTETARFGKPGVDGELSFEVKEKNR